MTAFKPITLGNRPLQFHGHEVGKGPLVLCLHGFPDSFHTFDDQLPALADAGYRAVAVAMRGYEPQSQPVDGDYHTIRMVEDVLAWIGQLTHERVHLLGHDWGATIAYAVAARSPERIASLATIAVPHPGRFGAIIASDADQLARSAYILFFQQPDAADAIAHDDWAYLEQLWQRWSPGWDIPAAHLAGMKATMAMPGVIEAALGWYRQALDATSNAARESQTLFSGPIAVPTLGISGEADGCIAADVFERAMLADDFPKGLALHRIADAGHFVHREQPVQVNELLTDWFDRHRVCER